MKTKRALSYLLIIVLVFTFSSCGMIKIVPIDPTPSTTDAPTEATLTVAPVPDRYTVNFEENEVFPSENARKASLRIDSAIKTAVKLLNTVEESSVQISDCDYDARPKQRDTLKYQLSKEIYDDVLSAVSAYEDYYYAQKDYPDVDLFNVFVSALDALRFDHTEIFLYSDAAINGVEYRSAYFMPGDGLNKRCSDKDAIRAEVELCSAVVERILEKMPNGLSNYEKCCYFAFVLCAANEYDYLDDIYLYDYPAYSALVQGKAICSGYAQAFYRLCREEGISCYYCRGTTPQDRHAWNMLDTENGPLYLDITWYDTDGLSSDYRDGKEQYLFMSQEDFDYYGYIQETCQ